MKRLTLVRHAHAESARADLQDFDRPLSTAGIAEASHTAQTLAPLPPAFILSSPATRALQTAHIVARALNNPHAESLATDREIYLARASDLLAVVNAIPDDVHHLMLFGHNPGISHFATALTRPRRNIELTTAGTHTLELQIAHWSALTI